MALVLPLMFTCQDKDECSDCGGTIFEGYIFMKVTADDLAKNEGLALLKGVDVGVCIRVKLSGDELDLNTVKVVDECCCK